MSYKLNHLILITVSAVIALTLPFYIHIAWYAPLIVFIFCVLTKGIGSEVGAHRLWSHNSFDTSTGYRRALIALHTLSGEGSIIAFAGVHRLHHRYSDTEKDPHNPHTNLWGTIFYQHNTADFTARIVKDLFKDMWLVMQHRHYFKMQLAIFVILAIGSPLLLWYYAVNVLSTLWINFLVNVACHKWGLAENVVENTSTNNQWACIFLLGAQLHNNHHARPAAYDNAWGNYKFDIFGNIIRFIQTEKKL
jgi:fatty-acid desaturase